MFDAEWEYKSLYIVEFSDSRDKNRDWYGNFEIFSMSKSMKDYKWKIDTYFPEKEEFTKAIKTYGVHNGWKLKILKNDKQWDCVKCCGTKGKCHWNTSYAYKAAQSTLQLRKNINKHTCIREFNIFFMTSKWLSYKLKKIINENLNINLTDLWNKVYKKMKY